MVHHYITINSTGKGITMNCEKCTRCDVENEDDGMTVGDLRTQVLRTLLRQLERLEQISEKEERHGVSTHTQEIIGIATALLENFG